MANLNMLDGINQAKERNELTIGVYFYFSKAFDTVNHSILLQKLNHYGIRGLPLKWISSYLENRSQFTTYNGVQRKIKKINCGVPQEINIRTFIIV